MKLSIIMPAYNEEKRIEGAIKRTERTLDQLGVDYEVIVVDDGSHDNTFEKAHKTARRSNNDHIKIIGYEKNHGKGNALKYGAMHATGDIIIFLDSDLEIPPEQIKRYLRLLKRGDILIPSKKHPRSKVDSPLIRRVLGRVFNILVRFLIGLKYRDTQSGLKALKANVLRKVMPKLTIDRYAFDVELLTVADLYGFKAIELPISVKMNGMIKIKEIIRMFHDLLEIAYRHKILNWYDGN
ncbi:MAG: glycosyltransferase [Promethearchaeota archaeon]